MNKVEIKYLKLLGYQNTKEDGAILQHKMFHDMGRYIWEDESFEDVIANYQERLKYGVRKNIISKI